MGGLVPVAAARRDDAGAGRQLRPQRRRADKGKTLSANVTVLVIAKDEQNVIDTAPPAVIKAASGADGITARMFRKLYIDDGSSE